MRRWLRFHPPPHRQQGSTLFWEKGCVRNERRNRCVDMHYLQPIIIWGCGHKLRPTFDRSRNREIGCAACAMMSMIERGGGSQRATDSRRRVSTPLGALSTARSIAQDDQDFGSFLQIAFRESLCFGCMVDRPGHCLRFDALHPKPGRFYLHQRGPLRGDPRSICCRLPTACVPRRLRLVAYVKCQRPQSLQRFRSISVWG